MSEPPWALESRQLATAWLTSFSQAVCALSRDGLARMFHPHAVVFGGAAYGPCTEFDALHFSFSLNTAKLAPLDRAYTLVTIEWRIAPVLEGSPPECGDATFMLCATKPAYDDFGELVTKGSVSCIHAHYSRRAVERAPARILAVNSLPAARP